MLILEYNRRIIYQKQLQYLLSSKQILQYQQQRLVNQIMNQNISFKDGIYEYISMGLQIWQALQLSLTNLNQSVSPPSQSPIPPRNYKIMTPQQFIQAMTKDMTNYILQHDVKVDHIIDYLDDILYILNTQQQDKKVIRHMANQLISLINQLPDGDTSRLVNFRFVFNALKGKKMQHKIQQAQQIDQQNNEQASSNSEGSNEMEQQNLQEGSQTNKQTVPKLISEQMDGQQKQEEDDGWIVVKKKSKK